MSKDAYYFSHDCNARNDEDILALRMKHDWKGYGLFWAIIEKLRESSDYVLKKDYNLLAYELRVSSEIIKSIVEDFGLFEFTEDGKGFYSERLLRTMQIKDAKSEKYSEIAKQRWKNENQNEYKIKDKSQVYVIVCRKGNEEFVKIGHTSEYISRRYSGKKMPYDFEVYRQIFSDEYIGIEDELNELLHHLRYAPKLDFGGKLESYTMDALKIIDSYKPSYSVIKDVAHASHMRRNAIKGKEKKGKETKVKETKVKYRECVRMKPDEYDKLCEQYDKSFTEKCLDKLNNYKLSKGKKYKSDYRAILSWVIQAVQEDELKQRNNKGFTRNKGDEQVDQLRDTPFEPDISYNEG